MALDFNQSFAELSKTLAPGTLGTEKKSYKDDRFWTLSRDENDNGVAIIRLLLDPKGLPFIKVYSHAVQSWDAVNKKKRWYLNTSPETIDQPCPASKLWGAIYALGTDEAKTEAKNFSRKMNYYVNILVVNDPANPENNGKIKLWKFGTKLFDKFMAALNPSEQDRALGETPKELFNPLVGNNIKLKIKKASGFFNYDDTTIDVATSVYADADAAIKDITENAVDLMEFKQPEAFKTYEESAKSLKWVCETYTPKLLDPIVFKQLVASTLGQVADTTVAQEPTTTVAQTVIDPLAVQPVTTTPTPVVETPVVSAPVETTLNADAGQTTPVPATESDDDLDFLNGL